MKILHVIDSLNVGGAQKLLVTYAEQSQQAGVETVIASQRKKNNTVIEAELDRLGVSITYFPGFGLLDPRRFWRFIRFVRAGRFDILHTHLNYGNILGILCARLLGLPVVVSMHNVLSGRRRNGLPENLEHFLLRFASRIVAVGENVATDYRKLFGGKVVAVVNAVTEYPVLPEAERLALREKLTGDAQAPLLVAVGRLTYQKGFDDLIQAFALIHTSFPNAHLLVAGDGDLRSSLEAETTRLGLQEHLHWLGVRSDVQDLLAAADLYVSSARWEGLSIAMLEAMSHGLALVVTNVGDAPKVITAGAGFLVPPGSPQAVAEMVCNLLANPQQALEAGKAARARIHAEYGAQGWFARLQALYREVVAEARR